MMGSCKARTHLWKAGSNCLDWLSGSQSTEVTAGLELVPLYNLRVRFWRRRWCKLAL